jgi:uncharacterized protein YabN with tetrapyrrole methylase and pyrophosphatase domain
MCCVNLARHLKVDPEEALRSSNSKFERRFHFIEKELKANGLTPEETSLEQMDQLWGEAKKLGFSFCILIGMLCPQEIKCLRKGG